MTRLDDDRCFNIGVALAGGSTRGAYSAGVMDFLLQALNEWEAARNNNATSSALPPWRIRLKTVAGTSAGGITAAVSPVKKGTDFHNNLYELWVEKSSLENLFNPSDLDFAKARRDGTSHIHVRSVLNSSFMDIHSRLALQARRTDMPLPSWADRLELFITTSNLRGVPYTVDNFRANQTSSDDRSAQRGHRMTRHRDWVGFKTCVSDFPGLQPLALAASRDPDVDEGWARVRDAAMATAALPFAFPSQRIVEDTMLYDRKHADECPTWPRGMGKTYTYDAVDGGVFHNEPLSLVRESMEFGARRNRVCGTVRCGTNTEHEVLSDDPTKARGAMILLHPSPRRDSFACNEPVAEPGLLATLHATFSALLDDANFQEDELAQDINDDSDFSKFLIAPARSECDGHVAIGTDALDGFGGILDQEIRHHDFMLGRKNAQQFLRRKFALPLKDARRNAIFGDDAERFAVRRDDGSIVVPIVPLCGSADVECAEPVWPRFDKVQRERIRQEVCDKVECRVRQIIQCFAHNMGFFKPNTFSMGVYSTWNFVVGQLVNVATARVMGKVERKVVEALEQFC